MEIRSTKEIFEQDIMSKYSSLSELSRDSAISVSTLSKMAEGRTPTPKNLVKIVNVIDDPKVKNEFVLSTLITVLDNRAQNLLEGKRNYLPSTQSYLDKLEGFEVVGQQLSEYRSKQYGSDQIFPKAFYVKEKSFSNLLNEYLERTKFKGSFKGFIENLMTEWNMPSPEMLGKALGLKTPDNVRDWLEASEGRNIESSIIESINNNEQLNVGKNDQLLVWQLARGTFRNGTRSEILYQYSDNMRTERRSILKPQIASKLLRVMNDSVGFTTSHISKETGISEVRIKHYLNDRSLRTLSSESPKEAYKLGKMYFPDQKDDFMAKDFAAVLLGKSEFIEKDEVKRGFMDGDTSIPELFTQARLFIAKQGIEPFAKKLGIKNQTNRRVINDLEDGTLDRPDYIAILKLATRVLGVSTTGEMREYLERVKEKLVEEGRVKKAGYVDDVLFRREDTRQIMSEFGFTRK